MKPLRVTSLAAIVVFAFHGSAFAADDRNDDFHRPGFYLLAGAAIAFENSEELDDTNDILNENLDVIIQLLIDNGDLPPGTTGSGKFDIGAMPGVNFAGGYRINSRVAIEGEFEWAKADVDFDVKLKAPGFSDFSDSTKVAEFSYWLLSANAKFFAFTGFIQPFALIGLGVTGQDLEIDDQPDSNETGAGFRFGGGADVYITRNIAITADFTYVLTAGDTEDGDLMSLNTGLLWRF